MVGRERMGIMKKLILLLFISSLAYGQTLTKNARVGDINDSLTTFTVTVKALISDSLSGTTLGNADSLGGSVASDYMLKADSTLYNTKYNHDTLATDVATNVTNIATNTSGVSDNADSVTAIRTNVNTNTAGILLRSTLASPTFTGTVVIPTLNVTTAFQLSGVALTASMAELNYVDGVTSAIQTQINLKALNANPTFTGEIGIGSVNVSETELGILESATLSTTELNYVDGVTSAIQTQINSITSGTTSALTDGYIYIGNVSNEPAMKAITGDIATTREGVTSISSGVILDADINASAGITATKLAGGGVNNTEFGYIGTLSSNAQTQLTANAGGIATNLSSISDIGDTNTAQRTDINTNVAGLVSTVSSTSTNTSNISGLTTLANGKIYMGNGSNVAAEVTPSGDVTMTNAGVNSITAGSIINADINASAAISATKLIDGEITDTELGYINTLSSNAQTQITTNISDIDALETLANAKFYLGNGSNVATEVTLTGDVTSTNAGVMAIASGVIVDADVNASANITATKLGTGVISNTELNYLNGTTSAIQTQIDGIVVSDTIKARGGSYSFIISAPQSSEEIPLGRRKYAYTVDSVTAVNITSSTTNEVPFNMVFNASALFASDQTVDTYSPLAINVTTWDLYTSFSDATITAGEFAHIELGTITGTPLYTEFTVFYTEN